MKVKDIMKKINYGTSKIPVFLQEGVTGTIRKAESFDYADYFYEEKDRTVTTISLLEGKMIIHYK